MKTIGIALGLAAIGAWALSCTTTPPVIEPTTDCYGYGTWGYWNSAEPPSVTVCTDGTKARILQFKGADGQPVPGGGLIAAPGCLNVPYPPGGVTFDWLEKPREEGGEVEIKSLLVPPHVQDYVHDSAQEYVFGCAPLKADPIEGARTYEISVLATSLAEAQALVVPVAYFPTGSSLPNGMAVHFHIEAHIENGALVIRSSLADTFDEFRIEINGVTVADIASGLNVEVTHPGGRWTQIVATLPQSLLWESMNLVLHQQGHNDPNEFWKALVF